jgi:cysteine desulfurase family protein
MTPDRVYLDNAATSFPKPPGVIEAMVRFTREVGASPGRGSYAESLAAGAIIQSCRERVCRLIGADSPDHVIFTLNGTDALNLAIKGLLRSRLRFGPAHAVATPMEHNSVLRPLNALKQDGLDWSSIPCDTATGRVDPADVKRAITPDTTLVCINHAGNVTGVLQPIADFGAVCRDAGVPMLVDAAQTLGHVPIDVDAMSIDLLAFPGHKGLLGPLGTGGLWIRPGLESAIEPLREGGTGSASEHDVQPDRLPERFEPGSHNTIGIAGLNAGIGHILDQGVDAVAAHESALTRVLLESLADLAPAIRVVGPRDTDARVGVVSIAHESLTPVELAMLLESGAGVLVRPGLHCAPHAHRALGTLESGGTVRISLGSMTSRDDVEACCLALAHICRAATPTS